MPSAIASMSSGSITFASRYAVDAVASLAACERRALEVSDELGEADPGEQPGEVRLVHA